MSLERDLLDALSKADKACTTALEILGSLGRDDLHNLPASVNPSSSSSSPTLQSIRTDFFSLLTLTYTHSTTLSLALKPPATHAGATRPLSDLVSDANKLTTCAKLLDEAEAQHGATLCKEYKWKAQEVIEGIQSLVQVFLTGPSLATRVGATLNLPQEGDKIYLLRTGSLHSTIEGAKKGLSKDNRAAVAKSWQANDESLADALEECRECAEDNDDDDGDNDMDDGWGELMGKDAPPKVKMTPVELDTAKKTYTLIRLTTLLHKRLRTHYLPQQTLTNLELDVLLASSLRLSSSVDDLISSLDTPHDQFVILPRAHAFKNAIQQLHDAVFPHEVTDELVRTLQATHLDSKTESKDTQWFRMCFAQIDKTGTQVIEAAGSS